MKYEQYFASVYSQMRFLLNCCPVSIAIKNTGNVPAEDIDIVMHFPAGFDILEEGDIPKTGNKPSPPSKPTLASGLQASSFSLGELAAVPHPVNRADLSHFGKPIGLPSINKANDYEVKVHVLSVKHNQTEQLDRLWLKYHDMQNAKVFTLNYQIMAANIPQVVSGKLHVKFIDSKD